ncbi:MAG TPA: adenylate/guanylate cyclase domain-containing protein [Deltaproteobacteria bacterium]|nr:adenylate/guanylate cyclase domain-containing protein [Deltaproteobacteria bacterium]
MWLPEELLVHLMENCVEDRNPAYLVADRDDRLEGYGGDCALYGLGPLKERAPILDQAPFLTGLLPLKQSPLVLPCVQIDEGMHADVHIVRQAGRHFVLLLSLTDEELRQRHLYEEANESTILYEKHARIMDQYLGKELVQALGEGRIQLLESGERRQVSILFADIRGFTSFSETNPPEVVFATLNRYLDAMIPPLLEESAVMDKIMGDAVMGVFGILTLSVSPPHQAVVAGMKILSAVNDLNRQLEQEGRPVLSVGIGISSGPVAVGILGSTARKSFSVVGHHVNLAARLQEKAESLEILVDENTFREVVAFQQGFRERTATLKGLADEVRVYAYRMAAGA